MQCVNIGVIDAGAGNWSMFRDSSIGGLEVVEVSCQLCRFLDGTRAVTLFSWCLTLNLERLFVKFLDFSLFEAPESS